MTSNEPGGGPTPGDPGEDATQADWSIGAPQGLPPAQSLPPSTTPPAAQPPAGPPPGPGSGTPPGPPATPPPPGYAPAPGYAPGYAPSTAPGMAWAPPPEVIAGPGTGGLEYAGALPRLVAWIVDVVILAVVGWIILAILFAVFAGSVNWTDAFFPARVSGPGALARNGSFYVAVFVGGLLSLGIQLLYFALQWSSGARATLGMRLLKLQVANAADGATVTRGQAVRRWIALGQWLSLFGSIPGVGPLISLVAFIWDLVILVTTATSPTKQGFHDRFADTVVVQPRGGSSNGLIVGCLVILGFLVIVPIIAIVALIFLGSQVSSILEDVANSV
jgi:uncharacterized RDD family membrane protein YckC